MTKNVVAPIALCSLVAAELVGAIACQQEPVTPIDVDAPPIAVDETPPTEPETYPPFVARDCSGGPRGWRTLLPSPPPPVVPDETLGVGSGAALAECVGDESVTNPRVTFATIASRQAHTRGRLYFEARVFVDANARSRVGIAAEPADVGVFGREQVFIAQELFVSPASATRQILHISEVIGVAADLDAGVVYFYSDGELVDEVSISFMQIPGTGAFRAGGETHVDESIHFNFGMDPFVFSPPTGYRAWASGDDDNGACVSDAPAPFQRAPILIVCEGEGEGEPTCGNTFEADTNAEVDVIVLGSSAGGDVTVTVNRPGRVILAVTSRDETNWIINPSVFTTIDGVLAYGDGTPTVEAPTGTPVETRTLYDGAGTPTPDAGGDMFPVDAFHWPYFIAGGNTQPFVAMVEAEVCLPLKMFAGGHEARAFVID